MAATAIIKEIASGAAGGLLGGLANLVGSIRGAITGKEALSSEDIGKIEEILGKIELQLLEVKSKLIDAQQSVIVAEAQGESWLQRNWRPLCMMSFLFIILYQAIGVSVFAFPPVDVTAIPDKMWDLLQIGIGGYIAGRSLEKGVRSWAQGRQ